MPEADRVGAAQAIEAARQRSPWRLSGFNGETGQLLFHAEGRSRPRRRSDADDWLVCHSPRYVRLEDELGDFELMTGVRALEVMKYPPPAALLTENAMVLLDRSDTRELCVVCDRISYPVERRELRRYSDQKTVRLAIHGQLPACSIDRDLRPIGQIGPLAEIQGTTLKWWRYGIGHTILLLMATGLPGEPFALYFCVTRYVDCPTTMNNVRFRMATPAEREALRPRLSGRLASSFGRFSDLNVALGPTEGLMVVECDEGVFSIWAGGVLLSWREKTKYPGFV